MTKGISAGRIVMWVGLVVSVLLAAGFVLKYLGLLDTGQ